MSIENYLFFMQDNAPKIQQGQRNSTLSRFAGRAVKRFSVTKQVYDAFQEKAEKCESLLSDEELGKKKYKDPFNFTPTHTLLLYTNHLPKIGATDDGIWRRLIVIPFNAKIQPKKDIKNYADYLVENAGEYILKWLIEGAEKIFNDNFRIDTPQCVQNAINEYHSANDWLTHFLEECCELQSGYDTKSGEFYQTYRVFCMKTGEYTRNTTDFYAEIEKRGIKKVRKRDGNYVRGVKLKVTDDFSEI